MQYRIFGLLVIALLIWQVLSPRRFLVLWGTFLTVAWSGICVVAWIVVDWASNTDVMNPVIRPPYWAVRIALSWLLIGLLMIWTSWAIRAVFGRQRRLDRLRRGHCVKCGYDVRATPRRCPECGARRSRD